MILLRYMITDLILSFTFSLFWNLLIRMTVYSQVTFHSEHDK